MEEEAGQVKRLLQRVLNPTVLQFRHIITGKNATVTIRNTKALLRLLYRDIEAGRAALQSLIEDVTLRPVGEEVEITISGTLGNVVSGWLSADEVIPFQTRRGKSCSVEPVVPGARLQLNLLWCIGGSGWHDAALFLLAGVRANSSGCPSNREAQQTRMVAGGRFYP